MCFSMLKVEAQRQQSQSDSSIFWQTYRNARTFNDLLVAKNALFHLSSLHPADKNIYDSLSNVYFLMGAFPQAILAAEKAEPTKSISEIKAYSYRSMGELIPAIELFEALFRDSGSPEHGYQLASLQFAIKRFGESEINIEKVLSNSASGKNTVFITTDSGETVEVSYLAAANNLKGVLFLELGKKEIAKTCFEKALNENPEFTMAKKNLESLTTEIPVK